MTSLSLNFQELTSSALSPLREMAAYESLWREQGASYKTLAEKFKNAAETSPSNLVPLSELKEMTAQLSALVKGLEGFGIRIRGTLDYPDRLRDADHPLEVLYYQGNWDLAESPSIAVVGARQASQEALRRTAKLVKMLVRDGYTIVSGLAEGVDTAAHKTAIAEGGRTIAVIGTPLDQVYPKSNDALQKKIAKEHLLISQVPFLRYRDQTYKHNRFFFPARNVTMSALSKASVIVEASDTSGTLYQARAALNQGRTLFILESCFENRSITWPAKYEAKGAIRVRTYQDILDHLPPQEG